MSRRTLLELVQDIGNEMDYDDIDSINDTEEALQLASVIKSTYDLLVDEMALPSEHVRRKLIAVPNTATTYNQFTLPEDINEINELRYLLSTGDYGIIDYIEFEEFIEHSNSNQRLTSNVTTTIIDSISYYIRSDQEPKYFTIYRDSSGGDYVLMNSYLSTEDATGVSANKTLAKVEQRPSMTLTDSYQFPYLDEQLVNLLLSDSKARCFALYKQRQHAYADRDLRNGKIRSQKGKSRVTKNPKYKSFGRRR